jgi:hypothetical protein
MESAVSAHLGLFLQERANGGRLGRNHCMSNDTKLRYAPDRNWTKGITDMDFTKPDAKNAC